MFEKDAPVFGFISLPSKTQVFEKEAPLFGLSSFPSQTQLLGSSVLFAVIISFVYLEARLRFSES